MHGKLVYAWPFYFTFGPPERPCALNLVYKKIFVFQLFCELDYRSDTAFISNSHLIIGLVWDFQEMLNLAIKYNKAVQEEDELPPEKLAIANVGRQDAKKHLEEHVSNLMSSNIIQTLGTMLDTVVF